MAPPAPTITPEIVDYMEDEIRRRVTAALAVQGHQEDEDLDEERPTVPQKRPT